MSRVSLPQMLQVPASLESQLLDFRRRVWATKMAEAVAAAVAGVLLAYLCVFALDRLWDTPSGLRTAVLVAATGACLVVPLFFYRWVWRRRHLEELARLLAHKLPRVGDQLLGVIELAHNDKEQARSKALCYAAIQQVARDAEQRDLCAAAPSTRYRLWSTLALAAIGTAVALAVLFPAAAQNAWVRLAQPWRDVPRFTFASLAPLPQEMVVAHGEPFSIVAALREDSWWRPEEATLAIGSQPPLPAKLTDGKYEFTGPPLIDATWAELRVGDAAHRVRIEPMLRPELTALDATVTLPEYLGQPAPLTKDVRGGSVVLVKGSRAAFAATASRDLAAARVDGVQRAPAGPTVSSEALPIDESRNLEMSWRDKFGLEGKEPYKLAITAEEDAAPNVMCEDLPRKKVVLDTEQLVFQVTARDDFGVKEVGMEWQGVGEDFVEQPAKGEQLLGPGGCDQPQVALQGTFTAKSLGIEPQPIELRIFTTDYFPGRERVYSAPFVLFVLNAEQHAIWITEQMSKWHRQALEVRDRELRLYDRNKQIRAMSAEELDQPQMRREIENQAAAERANGRRLAGLSKAGEELLRQAARNPELGVGHLDRWAEMLQILQDISANRMPSVADLMKEASQAKSVAASRVPTKGGPKAGQVRASGGPGQPAEVPKDAKAPPAAPSLADVESNQQPAAPLDGEGEPQKKNPSSPSLRLPQTTLIGQAKKSPAAPAAEKVDEAVVEQKDLLAEFEKVANEMNTILANLEGSTLVKRLKAASRRQYKIAGGISDKIEQTFGHEAAGKNDQSEAASGTLPQLAQEEEESSYQVSLIMDDMEAYFERRRLVRFKSILEEMRTEDVIGNLRRLADEIPNEQGLSIAQAEYWSDAMDRWAEDLVDPACSGACPGCRTKGSLPPSIVLEVLQILEGEINLREETRVAEQAKKGVKAEEHAGEAARLGEVQRVLDERVAKVVERIRELPDAEQEFAKEIALLGQVSGVMAEATGILKSPETGAPAIAAETEAIELLLKSKRINPNGGGGGGDSPGGGGGGDTQDSALALLGAGLNQKEVREDRGTQQAVGDSGASLPEEFRAGLDEYFSQLESQPDAG